jgi:peptidyl-prolyl cis-trans isomerase C
MIKTIAASRDESLEDIEKEIAESGMTLKDLVNQYRPQVQIETLMEAVKPESKVTEADAKSFYDENPQSFEEPEQVRARHILIMFEPNSTDEGKAAAREKIEGLLKRAKSGEDFAALATEYTEDPGSKETGGEYTFPRGRMVKPFEDVAFSLKVGEISDVVETEYGYHIIKVLEKIEAKKVSYDEVKASLLQYLKQNKLREFWPEYRKNLGDSATIEFSEKEKALREAAKPPVSIPVQAPGNAAPAN